MSKNSGFVSVILRAVALAMGVAVVVLSILKTIDLNTAVLLLGIGLAALAITTFEGM